MAGKTQIEIDLIHQKAIAYVHRVGQATAAQIARGVGVNASTVHYWIRNGVFDVECYRRGQSPTYIVSNKFEPKAKNHFDPDRVSQCKVYRVESLDYAMQIPFGELDTIGAEFVRVQPTVLENAGFREHCKKETYQRVRKARAEGYWDDRRAM